jgi:hypothetical protein
MGQGISRHILIKVFDPENGTSTKFAVEWRTPLLIGDPSVDVDLRARAKAFVALHFNREAEDIKISVAISSDDAVSFEMSVVLRPERATVVTPSGDEAPDRQSVSTSYTTATSFLRVLQRIDPAWSKTWWSEMTADLELVDGELGGWERWLIFGIWTFSFLARSLATRFKRPRRERDVGRNGRF